VILSVIGRSEGEENLIVHSKCYETRYLKCLQALQSSRRFKGLPCHKVIVIMNLYLVIQGVALSQSYCDHGFVLGDSRGCLVTKLL
jgi:hypothetical protein